MAEAFVHLPIDFKLRHLLLLLLLLEVTSFEVTLLEVTITWLIPLLFREVTITSASLKHMTNAIAFFYIPLSRY